MLGAALSDTAATAVSSAPYGRVGVVGSVGTRPRNSGRNPPSEAMRTNGPTPEGPTDGAPNQNTNAPQRLTPDTSPVSSLQPQVPVHDRALGLGHPAADVVAVEGADAGVADLD